jgi:hypothetical protein
VPALMLLWHSVVAQLLTQLKLRVFVPNSTAHSANSNQNHLFIQHPHFHSLLCQLLLELALKYLVVLLSLIQKLVAKQVLLMETFVHKLHSLILFSHIQCRRQ